MHHQITTIMKRPILTTITVLLFPVWLPIMIFMLAYIIAGELTETIIKAIDKEVES